MRNLLSKEANFYIYIFLLVTVFLTQFSSINQEVIDWDESTFFVVSNYLSKGELLYVDFWDAKPPIIFFYLGLVFKIFGSSLLVGRIAGDIIIALNVIFIFKILVIEFSKFVSLSSSLFLVYLFSYEASQPTMTEHLGILFIVISVYIIVKNKNFSKYYVLGILFSLAFNTRNNLAFACLGIFIYLFLEKNINTYSIINIVLGFITPIAALATYFLYKNSLENYIYMLIEFPLQNASNRMQLNEIKIEIYSKLNLDQSFSIEIFILITLIVTFLYVFKKYSYQKIPELFKLNFFVIIFVSLSIIAGGRLFSHYLIQLFPFIAIFLAYGLNVFKSKYFSILIVLSLFLLNINLTMQGFKFLLNFDNVQKNHTVKQIAISINELDLENKDFLVLENHIIYLYNQNIKPFKVVHPSNLPNEELYKTTFNSLSGLGITFENEFNSFIKNIPDYIFCENDCNLYVDKIYFEENYNLIIENNGIKLFQKK